MNVNLHISTKPRPEMVDDSVRISVVDVRAATSSPDQHLNWEEV